MNTKYVYWFVLIIVLSAWFSNNPVKKKLSPTPKKTIIEINHVFNDPLLIGLARDLWVIGGKCNIEYVNDEFMTSTSVVKKSAPLRLKGWAMDYENSRLPEVVVISFSGKENTNFYAFSEYGMERPDVMEYFSTEEHLVSSGYETNINLSTLPEGEYALTLIMKLADDVYICDNGRTIILR